MERERIDFSQDRVAFRPDRQPLFCQTCGTKTQMQVLEASLGMNSFQLVFANHTKDLYFFCPECHSVYALDNGKLCDRFADHPDRYIAEAEEKLRFLYQL